MTRLTSAELARLQARTTGKPYEWDWCYKGRCSDVYVPPAGSWDKADPGYRCACGKPAVWIKWMRGKTPKTVHLRAYCQACRENA